ncbi:lymphocyte antigen 6E-like [Nothoprocta perdicaria]|uniref:Lymphocyte antigen 6E-like n=1 Tax=Nothoprocta perdicaria TaxID=30464 RepID=A0A8C7A108_NOTPE|nr:lymphocyte antigen 6E-like [Nothoprocta perdicaria]
MKILLLAALVAVLCTKHAFSLTCFTCKDATSNLQCLSTTTCSDYEKYCLTSYTSSGLGNDRSHRITKKCAAICPSINLNIGVAGVATSCCETSLCNISGASSVKTSYAVIAVGALVSLVCVLRLGM